MGHRLYRAYSRRKHDITRVGDNNLSTASLISSCAVVESATFPCITVTSFSNNFLVFLIRYGFQTMAITFASSLTKTLAAEKPIPEEPPTMTVFF